MDIKYSTFTLDNGINVIYLPRTDNNITSISVFCKVGSINEKGKTEGMSHYLEHMTFKGTTKRPGPKYISKELDSVGAYFNAYTDKDLTSYIVKVNSDFLVNALDILSDMLLNSTFNKDDFEMEKLVVVEEINRAKDDPSGKIMEDAYEIVFKGHPLSHSIGSEPENILKYNRQDVINHFNNFYVSNNLFISIASNKSLQEVKDALKSSFFPEYKKKDITPITNCLEIQRHPRFCIKSKDLEQVHLVIGFPTDNMYSEDKFALDLIKIMMAGNMSSRLFSELREKHGLSYNVSFDIASHETCGGIFIQTSFDKDSLIIKNESKITTDMDLDNLFKKKTKKNEVNFGPGGLPIIIEELKRIKKDLVTDTELERAKGYIKGSLILEVENSHSLSDYFGKQVLFKQEPLLNFGVLIDKYNTITPQIIRYICNKYFDFNKINVCITGNYSEKDVTDFIKLYCFN